MYSANDRTEGLTIQETNKIRERLGLKPLVIDKHTNVNSRETQIEHNAILERKQKLARERRDALIKRIQKEKEATSISRTLVGPTLAHDDDETTVDIKNWAEKLSDKVELRKAEISAIKEKQILENKKIDKAAKKIDNLKGLRVGHNLENLLEKERILTLKDANILELEDSGDVLQEAVLAEEEKRESNIVAIRAEETRKFSVDEYGNRRSLLYKYDEDLGLRDSKDSVVLDSRGTIDVRGLQKKEVISAVTPGKIIESLESVPLKVASTYYNDLDTRKLFKKKKVSKKIKASISKPLPFEDSASLPFEDSCSSTLDSLKENASFLPTNNPKTLNKKSLPSKGDIDDKIVNNIKDKSSPSDITQSNINNNTNPKSQPEVKKIIDYSKSNSNSDISKINFVDDDDIQKSLSAYRKTAILKTMTRHPKDLVDENKSVDLSDTQLTQPFNEKGSFLLSASTDFALNLSVKLRPKSSETSKITKVVNSVQSEDSILNVKKVEPLKQDTNIKSGWVEISEELGNKAEDIEESQNDNNPTSPKTNDNAAEVEMKPTGGGALLEEPVINSGIGTTITLLKQKGQIREATEDDLIREQKIYNKNLWLAEKKYKMALNKLESRNENKSTSKNKQKKGGKSEADSNSRLKDERELRKAKREKISFVLDQYKNYNPEVNLEYFDEFGRKLNQREAFRQLSHKFHGKTSGKIKTEKRLRKIKEELNMIPHKI